VLIQALIAAALSFAHLHDVAQSAGQQGWKAWAYPISVDLLLVAAWRRLRTARAAGTPARLGWCWFVVALTASLGANVATAGLLDLAAVPAWLRILVAGWPAAAFLGGTLLAHNPAPTREPVPAVAEPANDPESEPVDSPGVYLPEPEPESAPPPPASAPTLPSSLSTSAPALPPVAAPLLAHAQKLADEHRAITGRPLEPAALRARLGIPAPLAAAITAQLT
jgi:hypothetical protein